MPNCKGIGNYLMINRTLVLFFPVFELILSALQYIYCGDALQCIYCGGDALQCVSTLSQPFGFNPAGIHFSNISNGNAFRALHFAGTSEGTAAKALGYHLASHLQYAF